MKLNRFKSKTSDSVNPAIQLLKELMFSSTVEDSETSVTDILTEVQSYFPEWEKSEDDGFFEIVPTEDGILFSETHVSTCKVSEVAEILESHGYELVDDWNSHDSYYFLFQKSQSLSDSDKYTEDERKKLATEGKAMEDGSFPISDLEDLKNAVKSVGLAKDYDKAKAWIIKRAGEMNASEYLPEDWKN